MRNLYDMIDQRLDELESALAAAKLLENDLPSKAALSSDAPFCYDSLQYHQWLQFVFLPKTRELVSEEAVPAARSQIAPFVEHEMSGSGKYYGEILIAVKRLDKLLGALFVHEQRRRNAN